MICTMRVPPSLSRWFAMGEQSCYSISQQLTAMVVTWWRILGAAVFVRHDGVSYGSLEVTRRHSGDNKVGLWWLRWFRQRFGATQRFSRRELGHCSCPLLHNALRNSSKQLFQRSNTQHFRNCVSVPASIAAPTTTNPVTHVEYIQHF